MAMSKKVRRHKSVNPKCICKVQKDGRRLCWWPNCTRYAKKYNLCREHYIEYFNNLRNKSDFYGDIRLTSIA